MALVGHISGSSQSNSVIGVSGSVIIANRPNSLFPSFPGSDVTFFVSGALDNTAASVFGGKLVVSGGINSTTISGSGDFNVGGDLRIAGDLRVDGNDIKSSTGATSITLDGSNVTIPGDLTVNGTTVSINTTNLEIKDSIIGLGFASGSVAETVGDRAIIGGMLSEDNVVFLWDEDEDEFAVGRTSHNPTGSGPITISSYAQFHALGLTGSLTKLSDGTDYLIAGSSISLTTGTNGSVTIDSNGATDLQSAYIGSGTYPGDASGYYINTAYSISSFPNIGSQNIDFFVGEGGLADDGNTSFGKFILRGYKPTLEIVPHPGPWGSTPGAIRFYEDWLNGSEYVALRAPDSISSNYTLTFPVNAGTSGEVLTTDGTGSLSWQSIPGTAEYFLSTTAGSIYTTGSTAFIGAESIDSPSDKGSDVFFYVSGSTDMSAASNALFGGSVIISGSMSVEGDVVLGSSISNTILFNGGAISDLLPDTDMLYNLGSPSNRWANVYTGDLHLRNDRGDWTVIEEDEYLSIRNNKTGKMFKFVLEPV
jgi:hypothetical protein